MGTNTTNSTNIEDDNFSDDVFSYGPIPYSWQREILQYCSVASPDGFICNELLSKGGMLGLGCTNIIIALLLGIILVQDLRKPKEGRRFLFYHDSLLFGVKFLVILGFYHFFIYTLMLVEKSQVVKDNDVGNMVIFLIMCVSAGILLVGSILYWRQFSVKQNNIMGKDPNNTIPVIAENVFQDFRSLTVKAIAIGITQVLLLLMFINAVIENIVYEQQQIQEMVQKHGIDYRRNHSEIFFISYMISAIMQASYTVGVNNVFQDISLQTIFWLRAFSIDGKISLTQPVYVSSKLPQEELKDYSFDDMMKVSKLTMIVRCIADLTVNMFGVFFVTIILPLHFCYLLSPIDFVLNAGAAYFICDLDDLGSTSLWLTYKDPKTKSNYYHNGKGFRYKVLHKDNKLGFEIREYSSYNYVEFGSFQEMKIVMADNTPLEESHIITEAKVGGKDRLLEIINIKQPIEEYHEEENFDNNNNTNTNTGTTTTTGNVVVKEAKKKVVAVAQLSDLRYDCSIFNSSPSKPEILAHANNELRDVLKLFHFKLSMTTPLSEGEDIVVFAKHNDPSSGSGEVWIYLDADDQEVMKLLTTNDDNDDNNESQSKDDYDDAIDIF